MKAFIPLLLAGGVLLPLAARSCRADVTIVDKAKARAAIYVAPSVMAPDDTEALRGRFPQAEAERQRERLRESVNDLAHYLQKMSGAKVEVLTTAPARGDKRLPVLIGELAAARFGAPKVTAPYKQGFRVLVSKRAIGLWGESDLATSYAIYEVLDRLGCRWFMPGEMGECIPALKTLRLSPMDFSSAPYTIYRGLWYADDAYKRRNRLGGLLLSAGHALGSIITPEQLKQHPDWVAVIHGKPAPPEIKWSKPEVARAIADKLTSYIDATGVPTLSLSPEDRADFDESEDPKLDAGDFDPIFGSVSVTDRLMVLANRVAERVTQKYPDTLFGMLAYVNYTRPPVREKIHPNIVPQIAPITYARAHPMTMPGVPGNEELRSLIEGWGKKARMTSIYFYGWFLAELTAPNPMITKWGIDVPFVLKNNCKFFQPETTSNFETSMHGLYMGLRLAWNPAQKPADIVADINTRFYGHAAREMAAYWNFIDHVWVDTPEYSGAGFGYRRRWAPARMKQARALLNAGLARAVTPAEKYRIEMASESLRLFELFMKMREDQAAGRFAHLGADAASYVAQMNAAADKYAANYAFTKRPHKPGSDNGVDYFNAFYRATYEDASRIARECKLITPALCNWKYSADKEKRGEALGWAKPNYDDSAWKTTDVTYDTWSALGYHNYFGSMWYRKAVEVPAIPPGRKAWLWLGSTDGTAKVFVNGQAIAYRDDKGEAAEWYGYCQPVSFEVTDALKPGANQISILCTRTVFNELGTGGLLAPVVIYRGK
jgi:hypothetical protein